MRAFPRISATISRQCLLKQGIAISRNAQASAVRLMASQSAAQADAPKPRLSRLAKMPLYPPADFQVPITQAERRNKFKLPPDVQFRMAGREVFLEGPRGCASMVLHPDLELSIDKDTSVVTVLKRTHEAPAATNCTLLSNFVHGVMLGWKRKLQLIGVGYKVRKLDESEGRGKEALEMRLGFSHPVFYTAPEGVSLGLSAKGNEIVVRGVDLSMVGMAAADIRKLRKPNAYTGKGIRFADEVIKLKQGKKKWG